MGFFSGARAIQRPFFGECYHLRLANIAIESDLCASVRFSFDPPSALWVFCEPRESPSLQLDVFNQGFISSRLYRGGHFWPNNPLPPSLVHLRVSWLKCSCVQFIPPRTNLFMTWVFPFLAIRNRCLLSLYAWEPKWY